MSSTTTNPHALTLSKAELRLLLASATRAGYEAVDRGLDFDPSEILCDMRETAIQHEAVQVAADWIASRFQS